MNALLLMIRSQPSAFEHGFFGRIVGGGERWIRRGRGRDLFLVFSVGPFTGLKAHDFLDEGQGDFPGRAVTVFGND